MKRNIGKEKLSICWKLQVMKQNLKVKTLNIEGGVLLILNTSCGALLSQSRNKRFILII